VTLRADAREWDDLAERDAYWAVMSVGRPGTWNEAEFFASGEQEVAALFAGLDGEGLLPSTRRAALDFGCGVGRLTRALASRFETVVGVDISAEMIARAQELNGGCRFVHNTRPDLTVLGDDEFDFVLSLIALQHVSSEDAVRSYIAEVARRAAPGWILVFQLPTAVSARVRLHPLRALNRVLRQSPWLPSSIRARLLRHAMVLRGLPEHDVRAILEKAGAEVIAAFPDRRGGSDAVPSLQYVARVSAA
jgi:SAM-dependent methyltransferase